MNTHIHCSIPLACSHLCLPSSLPSCVGESCLQTQIKHFRDGEVRNGCRANTNRFFFHYVWFLLPGLRPISFCFGLEAFQSSSCLLMALPTLAQGVPGARGKVG